MTEIVTPSSNTITVNSSESVCVIPDIAQIVYSVRTEAKTAGDCQQQKATAVSKVIELLKSLGVEETSIQTSDYYMHPIYNYSNNTAKVTGYEASTSLTVSAAKEEALMDTAGSMMPGEISVEASVMIEYEIK